MTTTDRTNHVWTRYKSETNRKLLEAKLRSLQLRRHLLSTSILSPSNQSPTDALIDVEQDIWLLERQLKVGVR